MMTRDVQTAADLIRGGGLVAVPTETVYGLAGSGLSEAAVEEIYRVKGRPEQKPLSLMVSGPGDIDRYCVRVPEAARILAEKFWPGPLTIVLQAKDLVPAIVRAGGSTVGLRCPDHPLTLALLRACDVPLAAYFDGKIAGILDGGPCGLGRESTIIDMSAAPYRILRQGALPEAELRAALRENLTVFGITGGTGCGKTTALQVIGAMGGLVIDCDEVYHTLGATSAELREKLIARFGPKALAELNAITHSAVKDEIDRRLEDWAMSGGTLAAIDAIALIESGAAEKCSHLVGITAPKDVRMRRIMARDGISEDYARARIESQQPDEFYKQNCDKILENAGTPEAFAAQCKQYFTEVLQHGKRKED